MNIVVTGSIAFDYLMSFPGKFTEHFLPEHMYAGQPQLPRRHDGQAARRVRAEHRLHAGAARRAAAADGDRRAGLRRLPPLARGGAASTRRSSSRSTASSPPRSSAAPTPTSNQIASFYTGAMANAGELSFRDVPDCGLAIISPNDPGAMLQYAEECRTLGIPFIWDPGQQCARMSGDELRDGLAGADDRHLQRLRVRADPAEDRARRGRRSWRIAARWWSRAASTGCSIIERSGRTDVPAVPPHRIVDPTGVGDAFRGGFLKGMARGAELQSLRADRQRRRRPTRSSTSADRATPTPGRSSASGTKRTSATPTGL